MKASKNDIFCCYYIHKDNFNSLIHKNYLLKKKNSEQNSEIQSATTQRRPRGK